MALEAREVMSSERQAFNDGFEKGLNKAMGAFALLETEFEKLVALYRMIADEVHEAHPSAWSEGSPFMDGWQALSDETRKAIQEKKG